MISAASGRLRFRTCVPKINGQASVMLAKLYNSNADEIISAAFRNSRPFSLAIVKP